MKIIARVSLTLAALLVASVAFGQPSVTSPEVLPDGRVTFRVYAPKATEVAVRGLRLDQPQPMTKGRNGVWSVTLGPLAPDLYSYAFDVDGAGVLDIGNREVKKWVTLENMVEVPGKPPLWWERQAVPHGTVHRHYYASKVRQTEASFEVYTPPGYDPRGAERYPVVFLLHGFGDDETAWCEVGRAHFIADNLLAQGRIRPAIFVIPNTHPVPVARRFAWEDYARQNLLALEQELIEQLLPLVETNYAVSRAPADRAIVGVSMGGGQALEIGLRHPELFQWIGGFSSSIPARELDARFARLASDDPKQRAVPRLLWLACGRKDGLMVPNEIFVAWLKAHNVPHTWRPTDGEHGWYVWHGYLAEFLPLLFR
jgi:enterochelin esterase-like enzyme